MSVRLRRNTKAVVFSIFVIGQINTPLAHAACSGYRDHAEQGKVVGGWAATELSDWPGISAMRLTEPNGGRQVYLCGATLIDPSWILTAAHCAELAQKDSSTGQYVAKDLSLRLAGWFVSVKGWIVDFVSNVKDLERVSATDSHEIDRILIREGYQAPESTGLDIALAHLRTPLDGPRMPLSFDAGTDPAPGVNADVMVSGFGYRQDRQGVVEFQTDDGRLAYAGSAILREVGIPLVPEGSCKSAYPGKKIDAGQVCAGLDVGRQDSCQGDSGGPLVSFNAEGCPYQIGIVSWGRGCAKQRAYGVYTRVSYHKDWILKYVPAAQGIQPQQLQAESNRQTTIDGLIKQLTNVIQPEAGDLKLNVKLRPDLKNAETDANGNPILWENQQAIFEVESKLSGRLILVDINAKGDITQIYPSVKAPSSTIQASRAGGSVLAPSNSSFFRVTKPFGWNKLIAIVVPEDFPVTVLQDTSPDGSAQPKGLLPEALPSNYLMNLIDDVEGYIRGKKVELLQKGLIPVNENLWTMSVMPYEIRAK